MDPAFPQHDDTIVPVRPGLKATAGEPARDLAEARTTAPPQRGKRVATVVIALLVVVTLGVFFWLPGWVEQQRLAREQAAAAARAAEPVVAEAVVPVLSPEEIAARRAEAEQLLANLLTQQDRLTSQSVASWGGDAWQRYEAVLKTGDTAFLGDDFVAAIASYAEATTLGDELLGRGVETVERALDAAAAAFAAGNAELAIAQYDIVLAIEPTHAAAQAGRARAERLPEVLELMRKADAERDRGELETALASYRAVIAIDPGWQAATRAIGEVGGSIRAAQFERLMSLGFTALTAENFNEAAEHFRGALALRPNASEAQDGLTQAEQGAKLDKIALTEARALAFERRELWDQAIALYRAILATDANLVFAQTGLRRAEERAGFDAKLTNLIDTPTLLLSDSVLADARRLLELVTALPDRGQRLEQQIAQLDRLVAVATQPLTVRLQSDQLTDVTLYRVGALGVFATKAVELRPGTYTAIGSRDGFRDVRKTFTVLPGRELPPVSVVCVDPI